MIRPIHPPLGLPWLLYAALGASLAVNAVLVHDLRAARAECAPGGAAPASAPAAPAPERAAPVPGAPAETLSTAGPPAAAPTPAAAPAPPAAAPLPGEWRVLDAPVRHSLARTLTDELGGEGAALAQVFSRLFTWDLDLRSDLRAGDRLVVAFQLTEGEPVVGAARLHSTKLGRTLTAYRWQRPGDAFASYWQEEGTEVPYRLVDGPIELYEQVTSLLRDRPRHAGMDFKAPVGTPVRSPRAGVVLRENWRWKANGNCLEIRYDDGVVAKFLHLSENLVHAGDRVEAGQVVARTGNTGRSTAPHLHYQLERNGEILDPLAYHRTERRHLDDAEMAEFQRVVAAWDAVLDRSLAMR